MDQNYQVVQSDYRSEHNHAETRGLLYEYNNRNICTCENNSINT